MRSREAIEAGRGAPSSGNDFHNISAIAKNQDLQLEVLLDIRDLLANPLVQVGGDPMTPEEVDALIRENYAGLKENPNQD